MKKTGNKDIKYRVNNREDEMVTRKAPFKELMALQDRMSRLFEGTVSREGTDEDFETTGWTPPVDIYETRDNIMVKVEVPGVSKDWISVEVKNDVLVISGQRPFEKDVSEENYHRIERVYGKFRRSFILGMPVQVDQIKAACREGVLEITLPKVEDAKPKKVEISGE